MVSLNESEKKVLSRLKDFQLATVNRVCDLFGDGYRRVLVADEVGLGKTLIAKGVIAKLANYSQKTATKDLFKVVYICSNQNIAGQNLEKLKIHPNVNVDGISDTRLSMQHLKIYEQIYDSTIRESFVQLIPLTPGTSFTMTNGGGSVAERALIYAIFRRVSFFMPYLRQLRELMIFRAAKSWQYWSNRFEELVVIVDQNSNGEYLKQMRKQVTFYLERNPELIILAKKVFASIDDLGCANIPLANRLILRLRKMMAEISVEMMDADLVIMDEFQRFPELIKQNVDNETAILAKRFFNPPAVAKDHPFVLLLSATPYKLYSTWEEIREKHKDEHYEEFIQVIDFLFEHRADLQKRFKIAWHNYSVALNEAAYGEAAIIIARKQEAEECLYKGICRTERMTVAEVPDLVEARTPNVALEVEEGDILAFVELHKALSQLELGGNYPIEYIKSAPYIMSFMHHYKLKHQLHDKLKMDPKKIPLLKSPRLWIDKRKVAGYKKLKVNHARYNRLREVALPVGAEKLLWVPPARPYYPLTRAYKNQLGFSKTLVFSAWEMVPRAIATLLSYEAECLTVGELIRQTPKSGHENRSYFAKNRFPSPRIKFAMKDGEPDNMNHLCLLYPSISLALLYDPIDGMNRGLNLKQLRIEIRQKIKKRLEKLVPKVKQNNLQRDERWYYIAPLLMDKERPETRTWFQNPVLRDLIGDLDEEEANADDKGVLAKHLQKLQAFYDEPESLRLGRIPRDLEEVLANMAIASPAVCALRMLTISSSDSLDLALQLAKTIIDRFNTPEAVAIVDLSSGRVGAQVHWKSVLRYCAEGNLQAVLDEYMHMLSEGYGFSPGEQQENNGLLIKDMIRTLQTRTATYNVDTYPRFRHSINQARKNSRSKKTYLRMRSSYAVGFYAAGSEGKSAERKDNLRLGFNSPFRPFVLATTSIGQEGLDFHYYCRNIVHWNLPHNPVDLEQREGRINRYKCHAIRQNIAYKYGKMIFDSDIWREMFNEAQKLESTDKTSELVPFWCLSKWEEKQPYKIQRVVPMYPLSKDNVRYQRLIKILSIYRLSLGQTRQEELIEYLFEKGFEEIGEEIFMNLSPYFKVN